MKKKYILSPTQSLSNNFQKKLQSDPVLIQSDPVLIRAPLCKLAALFGECEVRRKHFLRKSAKTK